MSYALAFSKGIKPEARYKVSEWSDNYRILSPKASAESGKWRTSRTPYLKEIMDCLSSDSPVQEVVFKKASQIGASEMGNNWLGYIMDHAPAPTLCVQPTIDMVRKFSKQRLEPLIDETPQIKEKVSLKKSKDSDNTLFSKSFPGGMLMLAGANSASSLRSMPMRNLFLDEIDAYPGDVDGEGDPVKLAQARQRTFAKRKTFKCSTPTEAETSRITKEFEDTDKRHFYVPCPSCDHYQTLRFGRLKWEEGKPHTARYHCESCDYAIENWQKTKMLKLGQWRAQNPDYPNKKRVGFFINSLYSPVGWYSWEEIAAEYEEALKDQLKMKVFTNTVLGLEWELEGEAPDWQRLYERRAPYKIATVPNEVCFLTAGIDIQNDRIEMEVVGWAKGQKSYSIDYRIFNGDTSKPEVWKALKEGLGESYHLVNDTRQGFPILAACIDTGFSTQTVYNWVRSQNTQKIYPIKGREGQATPIGHPRFVDVKRNGKVIKRGLKLWNIAVDLLKSELYGFLKLDKGVDGAPDPAGYCYFPEYSTEYFKQLTAEKVIIKIDKRNYQKQEWQKIRDRNEALDCRVYARAAAIILGIERFKDDHYDLKRSQSLGQVFSKPNDKQNKQRPAGRRKSGWI